MSRVIVAFAVGAVAGGLFVRWYVQTHAAQLFVQGAADKLFGAGSTGSKLTGDAIGIVQDAVS